MDQSLKLAYSNVGIPANYIENFILVLNQDIDKDFYFYKIYSIIDAKDKSQANDYYAFIASDPDSSSHFRNILRDILLDNITNEYFDMSSIYMESMYHICSLLSARIYIYIYNTYSPWNI